MYDERQIGKELQKASEFQNYEPKKWNILQGIKKQHRAQEQVCQWRTSSYPVFNNKKEKSFSQLTNYEFRRTYQADISNQNQQNSRNMRYMLLRDNIMEDNVVYNSFRGQRQKQLTKINFLQPKSILLSLPKSILKNNSKLPSIHDYWVSPKNQTNIKKTSYFLKLIEKKKSISSQSPTPGQMFLNLKISQIKAKENKMKGSLRKKNISNFNQKMLKQRSFDKQQIQSMICINKK